MGIAANFEDALKEIGRLTYIWTNTESLLVHIISGLIGCDKDTGVIIFLTLNTTRARIDLVERLAKNGNFGSADLASILGVTKDLIHHAAERNRYNHAIYSLDTANGQISTIQMRIADRKEKIKMGERRPLDADAMQALHRTIAELTELNVRIRELIQRLKFPM